MTQIPNLANLFLGIPTAGRDKKTRTTDNQRKELDKAKSAFFAHQRAQARERSPAVFMGCRDAALCKIPGEKIETPQQIAAFLSPLVSNEFLTAFVQNWFLPRTDSDALRWATFIFEWHYKITRHMRLDGPAEVPMNEWDPPTYPLIVEDAMRKTFDQAAVTLFNHYIARHGPNGRKRAPLLIDKMLNDEAYAEALMEAAKIALLDVLNGPDDPFLVQTRNYFVDLEERVRLLNEKLGLPQDNRAVDMLTMLGKNGRARRAAEEERALPSCALPPCPRQPRPASGAEERAARLVPPDNEEHTALEDELPDSFVPRRKRLGTSTNANGS